MSTSVRARSDAVQQYPSRLAGVPELSVQNIPPPEVRSAEHFVAAARNKLSGMETSRAGRDGEDKTNLLRSTFLNLQSRPEAAINCTAAASTGMTSS
jgi:hypothetical protein